MAISNSIKADQTVTVQDFIALQSTDEVTYYNYSILQYSNGYDMFITNLLYDYMDDLEDLAVTVTLTNDEKNKYRYKPYLLSYDLYGSTEMKFIIMILNGIIDPKEFDFNKIKLISKSDVIDLLGRIQSVNEEYINSNRSALKEDFKAAEGNTIWSS